MNREDLPRFGQAEKWNEALIANRLSDDPANYPEPVLIDPLSPELEETWRTISSSIQELGELTRPAMAEIWSNTDLAPAIRDRALLVGIGAWPVKKALGFESMRSTFGGEKFETDSKISAEYHAKVRAMVEVQHSEGLELLDQSAYLWKLLSYFQGNKMDTATFEEYLGSVNIRKAQPSFCDYGPGFVFRQFDELEYSRFPLLSDIFIGMYGNEEKHKKLFNWAYTKLEKWLEHRVNPAAPPSSPQWLDWANAYDDRDSYKLCNWLLVHTKDSGGHVNEHSRELMIQHFGWEILHGGANMLAYGHNKLTLGEGIKIAESLTSQTEKMQLMEYVLVRNQQLREEPDEDARWDRRLEPYAAIQDSEVEFLKSILASLKVDNPIRGLIEQELIFSKETIEKRRVDRQRMLDKHVEIQRTFDEQAAAKKAHKLEASAKLEAALQRAKDT